MNTEVTEIYSHKNAFGAYVRALQIEFGVGLQILHFLL
jgi:hypothetical protein